MVMKASEMQAWLAGVGEPQVGQGQLAALTKRKSSAKIDGKTVEEHEETEPAEEKAAEAGVEERFPTVFPLLEAQGELVEELAATVNPDLLMDPEAEFDGEELELLLSALEQLPQETLDAMAEEFAELTPEDADAIAQALLAGDHIADPDTVSGFLVHAAKHAGEVASVVEAEGEEPEVEVELEPEVEEEIAAD